MRNLFMTVIVMVFMGCTSIPSTPTSDLADGVWFGTLKSVSIFADDRKKEGSSDLLLASCKGVVRFWASYGDGKYQKLGNKYIVQSYPDSHFIYFLDAEPKQPDWVEIQSYSFLKMDEDTAALQWSRSVNNRDLAKSDKNRYFFSQGTTRLHRVSQSCDANLVP